MGNKLETGEVRPTAPLPQIDWQAVLREHQRWLRAVVYARLREPQAVDDVMQNVALAAVRQSAPLRDASKVGPWLYRLAVRETLQYRRRMGRQRKLVDRYTRTVAPFGPEHGEPDPLQWLLQDERARLVRQSLARLAPRDAEILLLKYNEEWNYHQIAEHLGISHSAVETRLFRARQRLRNELAQTELIDVG